MVELYKIELHHVQEMVNAALGLYAEMTLEAAIDDVFGYELPEDAKRCSTGLRRLNDIPIDAMYFVICQEGITTGLYMFKKESYANH